MNKKNNGAMKIDKIRKNHQNGAANDWPIPAQAEEWWMGIDKVETCMQSSIRNLITPTFLTGAAALLALSTGCGSFSELGALLGQRAPEQVSLDGENQVFGDDLLEVFFVFPDPRYLQSRNGIFIAPSGRESEDGAHCAATDENQVLSFFTGDDVGNACSTMTTGEFVLGIGEEAGYVQLGVFGFNYRWWHEFVAREGVADELVVHLDYDPEVQGTPQYRRVAERMVEQDRAQATYSFTRVTEYEFPSGERVTAAELSRPGRPCTIYDAERPGVVGFYAGLIVLCGEGQPGLGD